MEQELIADQQVLLNRDTNGVARDIIHFERPLASQAKTARQAATDYLRQQTDKLALRESMLKQVDAPLEREPIGEGEGYRFLEEKTQFDITTVGYYQTFFGLPVWQSGVSVQVKANPLRVLSAQFTGQPGMNADRPKPENVRAMLSLKPDELLKLLGLDNAERQRLRINKQRMMVYRYDPAQRADTHKHTDQPAGFDDHHPTLPLPRVDPALNAGQWYVVQEVLFTLSQPGQTALNWQALIEVDTRSVVYLRALIDGVDGLVFQSDPITQTGNAANGPTATNATLNPLRTAVTLPGLGAPMSGIQTLSGNFVQVSDYELPDIDPPTQASGVSFNYNARTDNFAAVNAYYNCDRFFRLVEGMGFTISSYFNGTAFPVPIDHRGRKNTADGIEVNAYCAGNGLNNGIGRSGYMLANTADPGNPISIAADWRVVLHELGGHGILWDHVNSANFGFAHSAGDSVAAIQNDPESQATDRFETFPWTFLSFPVASRRRHDRTLAAGWGWGGTNDTGISTTDPGYNSEQVLSTTLFRLYRSMGGDSADINRRRFAARYATYLIFRAVGQLTQATNPSNAGGPGTGAASFASTLMTADQGDWTTEGHSGGAYGKVIRWAFEKQGSFRAPGAPATAEGAPPLVDVYIQDGRNGEYPYQAVHWNNQSIWNRRAGDSGLTHEEPIVGVTNFAYVKIRNRGTQTATNVVVKGFHCNPGTGLTWPADWQPMTTTQLSAPDLAPNDTGEQLVGPFEWTPTQLDHECMLMIASATGDASNIDNFTAGDSIPEWRLVPHDNNIGQRNVAPVAGGGGLNGLVQSFKDRTFLVRNPFRAAVKMDLVVKLPPLLLKKGWRLLFANESQAFGLRAGQKRQVVMNMVPGEDFTPEEVKRQRNRLISIEVLANGMLTGGMTYVLDPNLKEAGRGRK